MASSTWPTDRRREGARASLGALGSAHRASGGTTTVSDAAPSSLGLVESGELARRAAAAPGLLGGSCEVCPRGCPVDRLDDEHGLCAIGRQAVVASYFPHFGEEDCLRGWRGSGTIFFSGCSLGLYLLKN